MTQLECCAARFIFGINKAQRCSYCSSASRLALYAVLYLRRWSDTYCKLISHYAVSVHFELIACIRTGVVYILYYINLLQKLYIVVVDILLCSCFVIYIYIRCYSI